ncbi:aminotransferase class I/II-fold pyridoxal phosphate-dependent enzyme [Desemzia sp. RIT804]|uniref:aminotransferase class I/II-fold pyridoxal phosphate-dependent enzyme n=1 Tax=Desemzia sp. RIT 804 TaxID=2810209 RepID=UPI0019508CFE|nr:aminotransferase class I/II-fold pyridoxal phosphate-dependent enzyme [Desemzia sp. RIT 804]MBM6614252.1 aminotransferase class I/II-fold pyridoxal phosphate-dependent enzyme [Desemzia sp. RIT 804]
MRKTLQEKQARLEELRTIYGNFKEQPFQLNLKRGVPGRNQLALSEDMLTILTPEDLYQEAETDFRNYGVLTGIPEAKKFFSEMLETSPDEVIIGGNSSLQLMYTVLASKMFLGQPDRNSAWSKEKTVKFLCPSPGYDRHFNVTEKLGFELIPIDMTSTGPDMDQVETLVAGDASIKGIWCIPTYSNPTGVTYSNEVVDRLSKMKTLAQDFIIMWDNAYVVHHIQEIKEHVQDILETSKKYGTEKRIWMFCSTSKITFPGAGVAALGACKENIDWFTEVLSDQTIGFDKINQKRHVKFLKDKEHLLQHMEKHAELLKPKFDIITDLFKNYFKDSTMLEWTEPNGGYFVHLTTVDGCAVRIVDLLADIGVSLTEANASYPYGVNPQDNSIRLAPTSVSVDEIEAAVKAICLCVELASLEKELSSNK